MKKIAAIIALVACAAGSASAGTLSASAGADIKAGVGTSANQSIAKLSTGVSAYINFDNSSYAAATKHLNGTKEFGSSAGDTRIYSHDLAAGTAAPSTLNASDSSNFTSWTSL